MKTEASIIKLFDTLNLVGMKSQYSDISKFPVQKQPEGDALLISLLEAEISHKNNYKIQTNLKNAKLHFPAATLEQIIYNPDRKISKQQIQKLADCSYIDKAENILITGQTGTGKSYLSCALGHQACIKGSKAFYLNLNSFIEGIEASKVDGTYLRLLKRISKFDLLILDQFGMVPLTGNIRVALLEILEDRYERKSVIIASQFPVAEWYDYINEKTYADAIMDRILANAHRFELKGKSLRKKVNH